MISNAIMLKIYDILVCNGTISDASLNEFGLTQFDIDITEDHITEKELKIDRDEKEHFKDYVSKIGKLEDDERKIIYSNFKGEIK